MARMKEAARKSTGNGGHKRKRALAQGPRVAHKKARTQGVSADSERQHEDSRSGDVIEHDDSEKENVSSAVEKAPKIRRGRPEKNSAEKVTLDSEQADYDQSIATRDPALLLDLLARNIRKHNDKFTSLEQTDMNLQSGTLRDTTSFAGPHTLKQLPEFLKTFAGDTDSLSTVDKVAAPHTAIVVSAGMRVADVYRALLVFNTKDCKVGKLITKHMKLTEMTKYLQETKVGIIVTTPKRLGDLISEKAIDVEALRRIVIDGSYRNEKKQTLFEMKEIFNQTLEMLNLEVLKPRLGNGAGKIEVMVF